MDSLGKRIKHLRGKEPQDKFANRLGVSKGSIGGYERDENSPSAEVIIKLCSLNNILSEWLLFGTGPMMAEQQPDSALKASNAEPERDHKVSELEKKIIALEARLEEKQSMIDRLLELHKGA